MEKFTVHILGCGSALPTMRHNPSSQLVNLRDKLYMIDCGEGTQLQLRRTRYAFTRLGHIFLSHLHGDHIYGLIGLISTFSLLGRTAPLHVYAHKELEQILRPQLDFCCNALKYEVVFHELPIEGGCLVYEDRSLEVYTIRLGHRVPSTGFLFREKPVLPHIRPDMISFLNIPNHAIKTIKEGAGWTTEEGEFYPHERLVKPANPPRSYAYCSDTCFLPENAAQLKGVTTLFHEATFGSDDEARASQTGHSTAAQAARMAQLSGAGKLVIGHFSSRYNDEKPLLEEAMAIFENTLLANEGLEFEV